MKGRGADSVCYTAIPGALRHPSLSSTGLLTPERGTEGERAVERAIPLV